MFGLNKRSLEVEKLKKDLELKSLQAEYYEKQIGMINSIRLTGFSSLISQNSSNEQIISEGYQKNATIFSIIDLLVKSACNVPPRVYRIRDEGAKKEYESLISGSGNEFTLVKASNIQNRALEPVDNSPLYTLLRNPNKMMGYSEWLQEVLGFKYLTGNSFIHGPRRSGTGKVIELNVWPAQFVQILVERLNIIGYRVQANDFRMDAPIEEIAHIKNFNPDYSALGTHFYGQSPISAAFSNLTINNNAITTGSNILQMQGTRGIIYPDDPTVMYGKEQAEQMEDQYLRKHTLQGRHGRNSGILWPGLKVGWINMGLPAGDLALLEQYNTSIKDLCGIYKVPSILLNDTAESKVESYREAKKYMYQQAIFPELISLRDELNRWLTPNYGKDLYIDFDFMSVPEIQEDMEKVTKQLNIAWWVTPNEKRKIMKFPPLDDPEMDKVFIPANLLNLSDGVTGDLTGGDPET